MSKSVKYKPNWIKNSKLNFDDNLNKIIEFYLFNTPCEYTSSRGVSLNGYGWKTNNDKKILFKYMLEKTNLKIDRDIIIVSKQENINSILNKQNIDKDLEDKNINKICMVKKNNIFDTVMFYIRCSLAHGRFEVYGKKNKKYIMENIKRVEDKLYIKARFIIDENILLLWRKIIIDGNVKMEKDLNLIKDNIKKNIICFIKNNKVIKEEEIYEYFKKETMSNYTKEVIKEMKNNKIKYDRSKKHWAII